MTRRARFEASNIKLGSRALPSQLGDTEQRERSFDHHSRFLMYAMVTEDLLMLVYEVCQEKDLRAAVKTIFQCTAIPGVSVLACAVIMGPWGVLLGGTIGSLISFAYARGKFKSVISIIRDDLTPQERERLMMRVRTALVDLGISLGASVTFSQLTQPMKSEIVAIVKKYLEYDHNMAVKP
ncbi:protein C19orf12 homolog isoform X1 [Penaeus chinensis]|uniref:protein C19orf12 homolog isoform X1 n=1 Tax=Penaeus chinensis TaxID=139456 RepID=UPI001FB5C02F|nr:protein C19orf12 homolog isoform X1 [Penaeus chinensis]